jgi:hypothetical protein
MCVRNSAWLCDIYTANSAVEKITLLLGFFQQAELSQNFPQGCAILDAFGFFPSSK